MYLRIMGPAIEKTAIRRFGLGRSIGWLNNLSFDSRGRKESEKTTKRHFL